MGFADRHLGFGGAGPGTPWGTLGQITARALEPLGYSVRVDPDASRGRCPEMVQAGKVDLDATQTLLVRWAYAGTHRFAATGPLPRLRAIATIMFPAWLGIATRWETGITDLHQVAERRLPVRVLGGGGDLFRPVLAYYGLSRESIEGWGGRFVPSLAVTPGPEYVVPQHVRAGDVDLILDNVYAAIPWQLIFGREDMPDDFAYLLAEALDTRRHLFRETHIPYSYDPTEVARDHGIPLHPGAAQYYRERAYPTHRPD